MKKIYLLLTTIILLLGLTSCGCSHEWIDATCTSPQRCKLCNKTEGTTIPHKWKDATCVSPKTCSVCGETEGTPSDHVWIEATCQSPRHCELCDTTEGETVAHTPGDWETDDPDYVNAEQMKYKKCTECGEIVKQDRLSIDKLHDGIYIIPSPKEFSQRLRNIVKTYTGVDVSVSGQGSNGNYVAAVFSSGSYSGAFLFTDAQGSMVSDKNGSTRKSFCKLVGLLEDSDSAAAMMVAMIQAIEPSFNLNQAKDKASDLYSAGELSYNGVKYIFNQLGRNSYFVGFIIE